MKDIGRGIFFSKFKKIDVIDSNDNKIGHVGDLLFERETLSVHSFIIYGSLLEEKMEAMHLRDDVDEILPVSLVDREKIGTSIYSTVPKEDLETTHTNWEPDSSLLLYSKMCTLDVKDRNDESLGHIRDFIFHSDGSFSVVVNAENAFKHLLEQVHLHHHHDLLIPEKFIEEITEDRIEVRVEKKDLEEVEMIPMASLISRGVQNFDQASNRINRRFHYLVLEAPFNTVKERVKKKKEYLRSKRNVMKLVAVKKDKPHLVEEFINIYNEIAITSVDPFEQISNDDIHKYLTRDVYLVRILKQPSGYAILHHESSADKKVGVIAGIGIHHRQRGKKYSSALMAEVLEKFEQHQVEFLQADVLVKNNASLGLFNSYGFIEVDDFYLS
ncbi:MAG: GNAT family N-acetyltransferase [Candidatus Heimdallarchaeota archaeon]|nr:GNAT family N-acetyltransferase [Candidatus Heimdallarchaeota archaeon]